MSVVLHLETGDEATSVMMLETNAMQRQCPLVVYQYMLSFVTDLARALGVPHRFSDFRESGEYPWKVE